MRASVVGQSRAQRGGGDEQRGARIGEHEGEPLGRVVGVERQIGAAGLEDAKEPDQHLQRALEAQPHHHLGADPVRAQMMRELARARIELAIAQAVLLEQRGNRVRGPRHLRGKQLPAASLRGTARAVSFHSRRMRGRSAGARISRLPIGRSGIAQPPPPAAG